MQQHDKPGTPSPWVTCDHSSGDINGEAKYRLETSRADEFMGIKDDVVSMFSTFNRKLIKEGYRRMSFMPGVDFDFQSF
jgi:hypothetical protein